MKVVIRKATREARKSVLKEMGNPVKMEHRGDGFSYARVGKRMLPLVRKLGWKGCADPGAEVSPESDDAEPSGGEDSSEE